MIEYISKIGNTFYEKIFMITNLPNLIISINCLNNICHINSLVIYTLLFPFL